MKLRREKAPADRRVVWQAASLLLAYPDHDQDNRLGVVEAAAGGLAERYRDPLMSCVGHLRGLAVIAAAAEYVETFDWRRRRTMFLTYYTTGDTRNRGRALLEFADVYRAAGVMAPTGELPDHLAVLLEFAATVDESAGFEMLRRHRTPIDMLHSGLAQARSPYAGVVAAVSLTLPPATDADLREARRLAMQGPPVESVGLEPFALTIGVRESQAGAR
ncbi:MAG TPA: nitrate reductase molybdenum cofactor assembly chaperone [Nakamurella sp.]|jgi:nitrate reductase delta subunit|nr:nitrate reductase molybdenum cofactor assembly chaperone [Nakamurella sp.]